MTARGLDGRPLLREGLEARELGARDDLSVDLSEVKLRYCTGDTGESRPGHCSWDRLGRTWAGLGAGAVTVGSGRASELVDLVVPAVEGDHHPTVRESRDSH